MRPFQPVLLSMLLAAIGAGCGQPERHSVSTSSEIFSMEKVYRSMFGPKDEDQVTLLSTYDPEVLWVTAIRADVVGEDGESPESAEYFCHSVLSRVDDQVEERRRLLGPRVGQALKMFTLVQGQNEIRFPDGFGMPVLSNDRFLSTVMVMNPIERPETIRVGVDSNIEFVRESEARGSIEPLFLVPLVLLMRTEAVGLTEATHAIVDGESCLSHDEGTFVESVDRSTANRRNPVRLSKEGEEMTGHWYVPPGRHVYRHRLEHLGEAIRFDTRAHYISAHLHPYGESLELIDLTTGETVFKALASNYPDRVAIENITHYSSRGGIPIPRDHEYEIVAMYDNTSDQVVDSMAILYLYLHDRRPMPLAKSGF